MRSSWIVVLFLGMGAVAAAQETRRYLSVDGDALPTSLAAEQEKKKQDDGVPTIVIPAGKYQDELPMGTYRQPFWSKHRPSPQTRIYLQVDSGEVEFEQWLDIRIPKKRSQPDDRIRMSEEFEFGLGYRLQLDLYANTIFSRNNGQNSTLSIRSWAAELRYALADWGVIPCNPTLYFEYILWNNQPDGHGDQATSSIEPKLLIGDELGNGWRWGANFFYERTLNDSVREHGVTASLIRTVIDSLLSLGVTAKFVYEVDEVAGGLKERSRELYLGPSIQVRLAPYKADVESDGKTVKATRTKAHLDIEPIFGLTGQSSRAQVLIIFGWDF